jgi:hypothetical protein
VAAVALLDSGANPNHAVGEAEYTPLMIAVNQGKLPTAQSILQYGANPDAKNKGGVTALMIAAATNKPDMISLLMKSGANSDLKDEKGETALDIAISRDAKEAKAMIERMLKQ